MHIRMMINLNCHPSTRSNAQFEIWLSLAIQRPRWSICWPEFKSSGFRYSQVIEDNADAHFILIFLFVFAVRFFPLFLTLGKTLNFTSTCAFIIHRK